MPGYEASAFFGMAVPKGTPRNDHRQAEQDGEPGARRSGVQAKLAKLGGTSIAGTPEDFGKIVVDETNKWAKVVKATGATAE